MVESIRKEFENSKFSPSDLKRVREKLEKHLKYREKLRLFDASITTDDATIYFRDTRDDEAEFFEQYRQEIKRASFFWRNYNFNKYLYLSYNKSRRSSSTIIKIKLPSAADIHNLFMVLEEFSKDARESFPEIIKTSVIPTVFIGHGRSELWRELHDHLRDKHGYTVEAYETGARAGHTIRDIVEKMASNSDMAFLVHTAEDEMPDGSFQSRPNVIHETGLFQGKLGFSRAIVLWEKGCKEFSNLAGIHQIRFSKGNIRETFGDVLATLHREFGEE